MKACPDCAEETQDRARVCRYCGYRFDRGRSSLSVLAGIPWIIAATFIAVGVSAALGFPFGLPAIAIFGLASLGAYLAWTAADRDTRWGDVGRSLLLGALLAFAFGLYDRVQQKQAEQEVRAQQEQDEWDLPPDGQSSAGPEGRRFQR